MIRPRGSLVSLLGLAVWWLGCTTTPAPPPARELPTQGTAIAIDDRFPPASDVERLVAHYRGEVEAEMQERVATAPEAIVRGGPRGTLGELVADAMRSAAADSTGHPVDVAFTNAGGIRNDIPAGPVTVGTLFEVMPFDNSIVVFELSGEDLQSTISALAARGGDPISGATYTLRERRAHDVRIGGQPLDPARRYRVATNDYVFDGGGRIAGLDRAERVVRTGVLLRDVLIAHVRALARDDGTLRVEPDGRVQRPVEAP